MAVPVSATPYAIQHQFSSSPTPAGPATVDPNAVNTGSGITSDKIALPATPDTPQQQTTTTQQTDPYAAWGGQAAYNNLVNNFATQKQNIYGTSNDAADQAHSGLVSSILDLVDQYRSGQQKVDQEGVNNELRKIQGNRSILDMVGRGIRSGGVMLDNKNATDSSAAGEIARAYGQLGRSQATDLGNQYALANNNIGLEQAQLGQSLATNQRHIQESRDNAVANIVTQARNQLAQLGSDMAYKNMPDQINIEQEKENIRQQAMAKLADLDNYFAQQTGTVHAASADQNRQAAMGLANQGVAAPDSFNFTANMPAQFQGTGPFAADLPIFTIPRSKNQG